MRRREHMGVRQVVTGHNAKGRSVFALDHQVDAMTIPNLGELALLRSADEPATYPNAGDNPAAPLVFPPVGGVRLVMATYSPEFDVVAPEPLPGMYVEDDDESGFHRTDTTDFGVLLGEWRGGNSPPPPLRTVLDSRPAYGSPRPASVYK